MRMDSLDKNLDFDFYKYVFTDLADPRTNDWFLVPSPVPLLLLMGIYLFFVKFWGPRYMSGRKPEQLNGTLIVFNFFQVLLSAYLVYEALDGVMLKKEYSLRCQPLKVDRSKEAMREARCIYLYFLAKISELFDTVFFVLRKKTNQISFLHIYHHTVMPIISWGFTKYCPGGHAIFVVAINSFIHVVMYMYYLLAACGPQLQKYLWWKKYITLMQIVQFLLVAFHNLQTLYSDCNYPKFSVTVIIANSSVLLVMFSNFYVRSYRRRKDNAHVDKGKKLHVN